MTLAILLPPRSLFPSFEGGGIGNSVSAFLFLVEDESIGNSVSAFLFLVKGGGIGDSVSAFLFLDLASESDLEGLDILVMPFLAFPSSFSLSAALDLDLDVVFSDRTADGPGTPSRGGPIFIGLEISSFPVSSSSDDLTSPSSVSTSTYSILLFPLALEDKVSDDR